MAHSIPQMSQDSIRVIVCGDDNVGKSTVITTLVKGEYIPSIQKTLPPITISYEDYSDSLIELVSSSPTKGNNISDSLTERRVLNYIPHTSVIIDTSPSDAAKLQQELKRSDVIWLLYSDHYTYERISLHWMPMLRSLGVNLPIVVCANKSDINQDTGSLSVKTQNSDEFLPLLNEFKEIEACVRCSAKTNTNVVEAFYLCQRAITHPISPIFDSKEGNLKPAAVAALKRVFFLCDKDQDGYLNFQEFSDLHAKAFQKNATIGEFENIIHAIDQVIYPETKSKGISEDGFIILNKMYAEKGRHETIWGILRSFAYTNSLSLNDKFLFPKLDVNPDSSVELSPTGYRFLVDLFVKFDKDNDGGLNQQELDNLFYPTPGIPKLWIECQFPSSIVCNESGYVTLQGWLAQWNLTTFLDYKTTLEYLAYLGFDEGNSSRALKITKPRKRRQKNGMIYRQPVYDRNVFNCFLIGAPQSGKTSLLELFLTGVYSESYSATLNPRICAKDIELRGGKQCYLILQELGQLQPAILGNKSRLDQCDVICYTYDSSDPDSFQYLVDIRERHKRTLQEIPCVFVALKADLDKQQQRADVQPENYTRDLNLGSPLHISSAWVTSLNELFIQLVDAATMPNLATAGLKQDSDSSSDENYKQVLMVGGTLGVMVLVSCWIWKSTMQSSR